MSESTTSTTTASTAAVTQPSTGTQQSQPLPPRPSLDNISKTDFLALQSKLKELNDWMDMPGNVGLHKQDPETRSFYNNCESWYQESMAQVKKYMQENVEMGGFTQEDADEMIETIESPAIPMHQKRGYGAFIASSLRKNELAIQKQEELRDQLKRKATEMESMENASFGNGGPKKARYGEEFTPKSTSAFLRERAPTSFSPKTNSSSSSTSSSSSRRGESNSYEPEDDMEEEGPRYINILQTRSSEDKPLKSMPLPATFSKHVQKMIGDHVQGIPLDSRYKSVMDNVMKGFRAQHECM